ncbi:hypothetical protein XNW1_4590003 [Xenorhabdus nematophila str. Websteri]|nr:hypothetical protein XNA1_1570001 [Xenorhabdus nematophila str. Anatoliense]CEE91446.1 hypothetical protein XNA1_2100001 [Xenorhabdus nematophila str. Anatoliense]CEF28679.1 hypothetical protein XNW1_1320003 [Xenorhabdus nematophila str. Websteri]CEF32974.1 hypothetical protein XNW1_4590003 [Xenorhabdus nematophila str. Websteri]
MASNKQRHTYSDLPRSESLFLSNMAKIAILYILFLRRR